MIPGIRSKACCVIVAEGNAFSFCLITGEFVTFSKPIVVATTIVNEGHIPKYTCPCHRGGYCTLIPLAPLIVKLRVKRCNEYKHAPVEVVAYICDVPFTCQIAISPQQ